MRNGRIIAKGNKTNFWLIGDEVYRADDDAGMDIYGYPMGKRWECPLWCWHHYRSNYSWATDVK